MPLCSSYGGNTFAPRVVPDLPGLHNKLRTESGPASVQPDEVASLLQNIQQDLEDYEAQIYPLERLRQEKEHLERYATQLQFLLSPFRKVPDEILRRIFDDCCDNNSFQVFDCDRCDSNSSDSVDLEHSIPTSALTSKPAMVVSSVCSRWRSHALSMPAIWSRISLEWEGDPNEDGYCDDECAEAFSPLSNFLHRSQQHPLTVNLKIEGWPFLKEGVLHPWLAQLFGQISRFRDFSFDCNGTFKELLDSAGISLPSFPVLTRLCIRRSIDKEYLMPFLDTTPNQSLRSQETLDDVHRGFNHLQLSHMDFFPEVADIGNLFDRCLNLSSLRIAVSSWDSRSDLYPTSPSRLEILAVRFRYKDSHDSRSVFPFLRLPSLKSLHLEKPYDDQADEDISGTKLNFKPFMVFVKQSCFQLTTFSIQQLFISDANLVHILIHLPTLQNLTVDDDGIPPECSPMSSQFIESLHGYRSSTLRPQIASITPRLRSLRLLNIAAKTFNDLSVVEMVRSRWNPTRLHVVGTSALEVDCLREFTMAFLKRPEAELDALHRSLASMERKGMRIVVRTQMLSKVD